MGSMSSLICALSQCQNTNNGRICIAEYWHAMLLLPKTDLTNDEVKQFQQNVDAFFVSWVLLMSHEGVTNHIHMLGVGHIGEYLLHHWNLYKHSQQGWEAYNSLLKTFFFHCTGQGGAGNHGTGMKSKIIPIAQWLSWCVIWLMGFDYDKVVEQLQMTNAIKATTVKVTLILLKMMRILKNIMMAFLFNNYLVQTNIFSNFLCHQNFFHTVLFLPFARKVR